MNPAIDARIGWGPLMNLSEQSHSTQHIKIISQHNGLDAAIALVISITLTSDNISTASEVPPVCATTRPVHQPQYARRGCGCMGPATASEQIA